MLSSPFKTLVNSNKLILTEAAVVDSLRRSPEVTLHPRLEHALLPADDVGREFLSKRYQEFIRVARKFDLPLALCAPTWRANRERITEAGIHHNVNALAVRYMKFLRADCKSWASRIFIGGLIGCKNDCYRPEQSLAREEARAFHRWQIEQLLDEGVDFLMAATLPAMEEAAGIAMAMSDALRPSQVRPYIISFVINPQGHLLDGTSLEEAIREIDGLQIFRPLGYMVNCSYPSFLHAEELPEAVRPRLIGFQGNASSLDHATLDQSQVRQADDPVDWGNRMLALNRRHGVTILGGCCGTGPEHLRYLAQHGTNPPDTALRRPPVPYFIE